MEHSGVYRNTENKPKHRFTCFNAPSAKKDSKFQYMAKSYTTSINNAREPGMAARSLFNMDFLSKLSKTKAPPADQPRQRPVETIQPVVNVNAATTPAPPANTYNQN